MSRDVAVREVRKAVDATGLSRVMFARKAKVDPGTLNDFLDGSRWAQAPTRTKIERALGWPAGRIADLADGFTSDAAGIEAAIAADSDLHPAAKAHLLNQLELLRLVPRDAVIATEEQTRRREAVKRDQAVVKLLPEPTPVAPRKGGRK